LHRLQQALEIAEQAAFECVQALRILSSRLHLVERPFPVALVDGLAQRRGAAEVSMGQKLDLADAKLRSGHRLHEAFDLLLADAVHAHERPQGDHVRVDGKRAAKQNPLDDRAHLSEQIATRTDPRLATREHLGHVGERHLMGAQQLGDEPGLFEDAERPLPAGTQQTGDALRFVFSPGDIRHALNAQFLGTSISPETIQQQTALPRIDTSQWLFDPSLGDRSQ